MGRYTPPKPKPEPFRRADLREAVKECGEWMPTHAVHERCPVCSRKVILHCESCKVQVTGCLCTLKEKMTDQELTEAEVAMAREAGLWLPERYRN